MGTSRILLWSLLFLIATTPTSTTQAQESSFARLVGLFENLEASVLEDYQNNEKWMAFIEGEVPGDWFKLGLYIDMADFLELTPEGQDGWVTVHLNSGTGLNLLPEKITDFLPISFGFTKKEFLPLQPDDPIKFLSCEFGIQLPVYSITWSGEIEQSIEPKVQLSVGAGCEFEVFSIEVRKDFLENKLSTLMESTDTPLEFTVALLQELPLTIHQQALLTAEYLLSSRIATPYDDDTELLIKFINYDNLVLNETGFVHIGVIAGRDDEYRIKINERGDRFNPDWEFNPNPTEYVTLNERDEYIFSIPVTPSTYQEVQRFKLQRRLLGLPDSELKILHQVRVDYSSFSSLRLDNSEYEDATIVLDFNFDLFDFDIENRVLIMDQSGNQFTYQYQIDGDILTISGIDIDQVIVSINDLFSDAGFTLDSSVELQLTQTEDLVVDFSSDTQYLEVGNTVSFKAQVNRTGAEIEEYIWDLNEDGITDATSETSVFTYNEIGVYNITLTVTDIFGEVISKTRVDHVNVVEQKPEQTISIITPTKPYIVGEKKTVVAQINPPNSGVNVTFNSIDDNVAKFTSTTATTNSDGYAGVSINFNNPGNTIISASAEGFGQENAIADVISVDQPTFIPSYEEGTLTESIYRVYILFDSDIDTEVVFETNNGIWNKSGKESAEISTTDNEVSTLLTVDNENETKITVSVFNNTYTYYFTPELVDQSENVSFFKAPSASNLLAFDWSHDNFFMYPHKDGDLRKLNSFYWSETSLDTGARIRGLKVANTTNMIALSTEGDISIWDIDDLIELRDQNKSLITSQQFLQWSFDDSKVSIANSDDFHLIINSSTLSTTNSLQVFNNATDFATHPSKNHYAVSNDESLDHGVYVYNLDTGSELKRIDITPGDTDLSYGISYSYDGDRLAISDAESNTTRFFETTNYTENSSPISGGLRMNQYHPSKNIIAVVTTNNMILIYDLDSSNVLARLSPGSNDEVDKLEWSKDGAMLAVGHEDLEQAFIYSPFDQAPPSFEFDIKNSNSSSYTNASFVGYDGSGFLKTDIFLNEELIYSQSFDSGEESTIEIEGLIDGINTVKVVVNDRFLNSIEKEFEVVKEEKYSISGNFISDLELSLYGINIFLDSVNGTELIESNESGSFEFEIGISDSITIKFEKEGLKFDPEQIILNSITEPQELNINVSKLLYDLNISVSDSEGAAIPEVLLKVTTQDSTSEFLTNIDGEANFFLEPGSNYEIIPDLNFYTFSPTVFSIDEASQDYSISFSGNADLNNESDLSIKLATSIVLGEVYTISIVAGEKVNFEEITSLSFDLVYSDTKYIMNSGLLGNVSNESTALNIKENEDTLSISIESNIPLTGSGNLVNLSFTANDPGTISYEVVDALGMNSLNESVAFSVSNYSTELMNSAPFIVSNLKPLDNLFEDFDSFLIADLDTIFIDKETNNLLYKTEYQGDLLDPLILGDSLIIKSKKDKFGSDSLLVKAFDSFGDSVSQQLVVSIKNVNDAPVLIINKSVVEFSATDSAFINYSVTDVDNAPEEIAVSIQENSSAFSFATLVSSDSLIVLKSNKEADSLTDGKLYVIAEDKAQSISIDSILVNIISLVKNEFSDLVPKEFSLEQNYPNPFNPSTNIRFGLPKQSNVKIEIFNLLGQRVYTLVDENLNAGFHIKKLNMSNFASGLYIYRLETSGFVQVEKLMLIK